MYDTPPKTRKIHNSISMDENLWNEIDKYRFGHKIDNRSAAIEVLLKRGLDVESPREKANNLMDNIENKLMGMEKGIEDDIVQNPQKIREDLREMTANIRLIRIQTQKL